MRREAVDSFVELIRSNWRLARRALADIAFPSGPREMQRKYYRQLGESLSPDVAAKYFQLYASYDVTPFLDQVRAPTLVLHRRGDRSVPVRAGRDVAALITDARFVALEGDAGFYIEDPEETAYLLAQFLDEGRGQSTEALPPDEAAVHTILFTDMESSTALAQRFGDAGAHEVRRVHNEIVRAALNDNGGNEIKHTGDGIMASFTTASSALKCAIAIQRGVAAHVEEHPEHPLGLYIGLNAGEPIVEEQDLFGTSVDLAARLVDHAQPGQIIASDVVRQLAAGKDFLFSDLGETELRGFEDPVKLWEVRWREQGV